MIAAAAFGAAWGSFLGVVIDRVPSGASVLRPRSACPACGRALSALDLIPVVSWLALRGRCRSCGARIPGRSTLMEVASAILAVACVASFALPLAVPLGVSLTVLVALAAIDLEHHRLPNAIVYPVAGAAIVWVTLASALGADVSLVGAAVGAVGYGGGLYVVALVSRGGMGMGDVKVAALIGWILGAVDGRAVAAAVATAFAIGGVVGLVAIARGAGRRSAVPFGPMLALGAIVGAFWGPALADGYLSWIGR